MLIWRSLHSTAFLPSMKKHIQKKGREFYYYCCYYYCCYFMFFPKTCWCWAECQGGERVNASFANRSYTSRCLQASEFHYQWANTDFEHFTRIALISTSVLMRKWLPANSLPISKCKKVAGLPLVLKMGGWEVTAHSENPRGTCMVPGLSQAGVTSSWPQTFVPSSFCPASWGLWAPGEKQALV